MAKGVLYVETRPTSEELTEEYNQWYDYTHLPEVVAVEGIMSARRLVPVNADGPYVAMYEVEGDDLEAIVANLVAAAQAGAIKLSPALSSDPPPVMRLLQQTSEYRPE
ncbi:hypothetical protein G352_23696 [Rhodococcus ruber BKS 20-38]|uniref:EthD domain-containing protein n=1 Tax=Rhodococcus ruber BKS 20-38 TaxID=1278076 RepID=M2WZV1_9NOCA|nr:hypothetical protein [Rhodococcus ruber]EME54291.1 hypothetical protein G352_23696 [Rhodococcus ruber BKS 20-38]